MVVAKDYAWNEPVVWCQDCFNDESSVIFLEDIMINKSERISNDEAEEVFEIESDEFLTTYVDVDKKAIASLLSGTDEHFKLERIVITDKDELKLYFDRKQKYYYSWSVVKSLRPSFTVVRANKMSGIIREKTRISLIDGKFRTSRLLFF